MNILIMYVVDGIVGGRTDICHNVIHVEMLFTCPATSQIK